MNDARLAEAYALHKAGRLSEAAKVYDQIVQENPKNFDVLLLLGALHLQTGQFADADQALNAAVALNPNSVNALSLHARALQGLERRKEAIAVFDRLLTLRSDNAVTWNNRGNMLLETGRIDDAMQSYDRALALDPAYAEAWHNRGVARIQSGNYRDAETDLNRALMLKPDYTEAFEHRGVAFALQGRNEEALESYNAALKLQPSSVELLGRTADILLRLGRPLDALAAYDQMLSLARNQPDAWHSRGMVLSRLGRLDDALESFNCALTITPNHIEGLKSRAVLLTIVQRYADALKDYDRALSFRRDDSALWQGRGAVLARLNHDDEALASFTEALRLAPKDTASLYNRASHYSRLARYEDARRDVEMLLQIDPDYPLARGLLMHVLLHTCDWSDVPRLRHDIATAIEQGQRVIHPFGLLGVSDSASEQLQCAQILVKESYPVASTPIYRGEPYHHDRIRVAYLSSDFYAHAIPFLIAGLFEHHDQSRFETFGISYGPNDKSEMRARLEKGFTRFIDVAGLSDASIAAKLRELEVDIAVDLKGYTGGAQPGILAWRPAPIQVHYLGYPGTMGADYIDYLIADHTLVPEEHRAFYSEQIVYLPDTYQANDNRRRIGVSLTRTEAGLPENGFVFCCFNGNQKIMSDVFRIWMSILSRVDGSVLWLLQEHPAAAVNLQRASRSSGLDPERLVFAKRVPLEEHLARLKLADLVLDTLPYGAHTTASDALWAGVPVLTRLGESFQGRVAASLLSAVGMPELITHSAEEYERRACEFAQTPRLLSATRAKLARNRETMPLFETARITRHLEAAYEEMWSRHQRGERPASFEAH